MRGEGSRKLAAVFRKKQDALADELRAIEAHDTDYSLRYGLVLHALYLAWECGYPAGLRIDPNEQEWPCAYIELPTGQVSWHMPQHTEAWDGHSTATKYARIREFRDSLAGVG